MGVLNAVQMAVVGEPPELPEGVEWPEIRYEIHDLGDMPDDFRPGAYMGQSMLPKRYPGVASPLAGYLAVYRRAGLWFAYSESEGGSQNSRGLESRGEAEQELRDRVHGMAAFWMEKVRWRLAGDRAPADDWRTRRGGGTYPVIRCGGSHYVFRWEPSDAEYTRDNRYGCFGFGGARVAFRMHATGERVESRNCFTQGDIPAEFLDLLPDNADQEPDSGLLTRVRRGELADEETAKRQERAWRDEALRAWRGPADLLRAHEVATAWEAAHAELLVRYREEGEAEELALKWRADAVAAWRGSWAELIPADVELWEMRLQEEEYEREMWADYYASVL